MAMVLVQRKVARRRVIGSEVCLGIAEAPSMRPGKAVEIELLQSCDHQR